MKTSPTVAFATACGVDVDFEFLFGALEHHSKLSTFHVVLDVSPAAKRRSWRNLPHNVVWVYDDSYKSGDWKTFMCRQAKTRAFRIAMAMGVDVVVDLDSDEFVSREILEQAKLATPNTYVETMTVHWGSDGLPYYSEEDWGRKVWHANIHMEVPQNTAWQKHPLYDGNPERHPIPTFAGAKRVRDKALAHHHLHWAFPQKGQHIFEHYAIANLPRDGVGFWPQLLVEWRAGGAPPSQRYL